MTRTPIKPANPMKRHDGAGHLEPHYAANLLARSRAGDTADAPAFIDGPQTHDDAAEKYGEGFVQAATSGDDLDAGSLDEVSVEEAGGPFITTTGAVEFAKGTDKSNPKGAKREPFPKT